MIKYIILILVTMSSCSSQPDYEVGYLTKGNPDNSYLDSCETYCCGD
jgi:hypothetical protein